MPDGVFLSYALEDRPTAKLVRAALERGGLTVWSDQDVPVGASLAATLQEAVERADVVVVLLSKASVQSEWVRRETYAAIAAGEADQQGKLILPVLLEDVEVPFFLRQYVWLDLQNPQSRDVGLAKLVDAAKRNKREMPRELQHERAFRNIQIGEDLLRGEIEHERQASAQRSSWLLYLLMAATILTLIVPVVILIGPASTNVVESRWFDILVGIVAGLAIAGLGQRMRK